MSKKVEQNSLMAKGWRHPLVQTSELVFSVLDWSGRFIVFACMVGMFAFLLINIVLRYTTGNGIPWAYEIHALLLPWVVAGGVVVAANRHRNIAVTLLLDRLNGRPLKILQLLIQIAVLVICIGVLISSRPILFASQFQSYATIDLKQVWGYSSLVFAFAGMAIIAFLQVLRALAGIELNVPTLENSSLS